MVPSLITNIYYNYPEIRPLLQSPCKGSIYKGQSGDLLGSGKGSTDKAGLSVSGQTVRRKCAANAVILS